MRRINGLICSLLICSSFIVPRSAFPSSSVPSAINYQGRLTDNMGLALPGGPYLVAFRIWDDPTADGAASLIWGREYPLNIMTGGVFNIILSDNGGPLDNPEPVEQNLVNAFKGQDRFLGLTITRTPSGDVSDPKEISPRQRLVSAPFAFASEMAHRAPDTFEVGGTLEVAKGAWISDGIRLQSGNLALQGHWISHDGGNTGLTVNALGYVGIGTTNPASALHVKGRIWDKTGEVMPVGVVLPYGGGVAPKGWLLCDGAAVSRTSYPTLYSIIGTQYGAGDGYSTFNLPDMRGRVPVGGGSGTDLTARTLGEKMGEENHTLTVEEMPSHAHGSILTADRRNYGYHAKSGPNDGVNIGTLYQSTEATGGSQPHNNMQPSLVLNYIIKY